MLKPCLWTHVTLLLHWDSRAMSVPVPPGGTHSLGMPSTRTPWLLVQNTGAKLPVENPWRGRGGCTGRSRFKGVGECWGGVTCQADMYTLTAGFDPVWTHLHKTFCSISHVTLCILQDGDKPGQIMECGRTYSVLRLKYGSCMYCLDIKALTVQLKVNNSQSLKRRLFYSVWKTLSALESTLKRKKMRDRQQKHSW